MLKVLPLTARPHYSLTLYCCQSLFCTAVVWFGGGRESAADLQLAAGVHRSGRQGRLCAKLLFLIK